MVVADRPRAAERAGIDMDDRGGRVTLVRMDAEAASALLELNTVNRTVSEQKVSQIVADMHDGLFRFVGDPIRTFTVTEENKTFLIDGQHRLFAVTICGKAVPFLLINFVGSRHEMAQTILSIDKGHGRTLGNDVTIGRKIGDDPYSKDYSDRAIASAINALAYADLLIPKGLRIGRSLSLPAKETYATRHGREIAAIASAASYYRSKSVRKNEASVGWLTGFLLAWRKSPDAALEFWQAICDGFGDHIFKDSPALRLREEMDLPLNKLFAKYGTDSRIVLAAHRFVKCWNAHCEGRTIKQMRFDKDFPEALEYGS
jgi:hypothetical protein